MKKKNLFVAGGIIVAIFVIICIIFIVGDPNLKIGFAGNKTSKSITASFQYFDGTDHKKIDLQQGETLKVNYELKTSKGELKLNVLDEQENVVKSSVEEQGTIEIKVESSQKYTIEVEGTKAKGSFDVSWVNSQ